MSHLTPNNSQPRRRHAIVLVPFGGFHCFRLRSRAKAGFFSRRAAHGAFQMLSNIARAEADRKRQLEADARAIDDKAQRKLLWEAFNAACEFVPRGPVDVASRTWAGLVMAACSQLKTVGEAERLEKMRYAGSNPVHRAGMESAYQVCRQACAGDLAEVRIALQTLIETGAELDSSFRLFLESVRDNRRWWSTTDSNGR